MYNVAQRFWKTHLWRVSKVLYNVCCHHLLLLKTAHFLHSQISLLLWFFMVNITTNAKCQTTLFESHYDWNRSTCAQWLLQDFHSPSSGTIRPPQRSPDCDSFCWSLRINSSTFICIVSSWNNTEISKDMCCHLLGICLHHKDPVFGTPLPVVVLVRI